ncbi:MAG: HvfB family MNIO-type RiPP peptide maturase [Bacteroidia bacterium]
MRKQYTGIGFRKDFAEELLASGVLKPSFIELAPENWIGMGGYWKKQLDKAAEKFPITCHGLSLSIGSPDELDVPFVKSVKKFLDQYKVKVYSEHLSYSKCDNAHLYDLLPIPFRMDAVKHIVQRIEQVQDILEQPLVLENVSYYTPIAAEMKEHEFISAIVKESGCNMLLDVNNVYVNAFNHKYDAKEFLNHLPLDKVAYIHMAGHEQVSDTLIIDTHGQAVIDPVFELFEYVTGLVKPVPVLLERDFNIPELVELQGELERMNAIIDKKWQTKHAAA